MTKKTPPPISPIEAMNWLGDVREVTLAIDETHPLVVRHVHFKSGPLLQPSVPFPEKHPYCELNFLFSGRATQFIGLEQVDRGPGELMLLGPGTPHYALCKTYPHRSVTVHFLPVLLFEMGPEIDGARLLARFTTPQPIQNRVIPPPAKLRSVLEGRFEEIIKEFEGRRIGSEFRLRALLMESLVDIYRWEESAGRELIPQTNWLNWSQIEKALRYIHEHYSEPLYVEQIAGAVGLSVNRLQATFRDALGMSCVHYLRAVRISHAKALLCVPDARITEIALTVGFDTLSHFNTSFRQLIGMSPTEYMRSQQQEKSPTKS